MTSKVTMLLFTNGDVIKSSDNFVTNEKSTLQKFKELGAKIDWCDGKSASEYLINQCNKSYYSVRQDDIIASYTSASVKDFDGKYLNLHGEASSGTSDKGIEGGYKFSKTEKPVFSVIREYPH